MALKTVLENFAKAQKEYDEKSKTLGVEAQKAIAAEIAEALPKGHVLVWTQSTPYFNDGDACVFSVNSSYVLTDEQHKDDDFRIYDGVELGEYGDGKKSFPELSAIWAKLESNKSRLLMLAAFGDHARVVVKPNGSYKRESYEDHD